MPASTKSAIPEYVGLKFISACLGVDYKQAQDAVRHAGMRAGQSRLFNWRDVDDAIGRRFIPSDAIELLAKHVDAASTHTARFEVPMAVYDAIMAAWHAKGLTPTTILTAKSGRERKGAKAKTSEPKKKGAKSDPEPEVSDDDAATLAIRAQIDADRRITAEVQRERLTGQREANEMRRLQHRRLSGQLCDRAMVKQTSSDVARTVQRFISEMPSRLAGYLQQTTAMSDEEVNIVEQMLIAEVPRFMRELKREVSKIEEQGVSVATAKRYGERSGGDLALEPMIQ